MVWKPPLKLVLILMPLGEGLGQGKPKGWWAREAWKLFLKWDFFFFFQLFIWLHQILVAACGIFSCIMWNLVSWPGLKPGPPALGVWNLSHWTTREVSVGELLDDEWIYRDFMGSTQRYQLPAPNNFESGLLFRTCVCVCLCVCVCVCLSV